MADDDATTGAIDPPAPGPEQTGSPEQRRVPRVTARQILPLAISIAVGLLLTNLIAATVVRLRDILVMLLVSLFLSFAMEPAVQWLVRRGVRRGLGTFLVFLATALLLVGFVAAMLPLIVGQIRDLVERGPTILDGLADQADRLPMNLAEPIRDWLERQRTDLPRRLPSMLGDVSRGALGVGETVLGLVVQALTVALVTFYLVADGPKLRRTLVSRVEPGRQAELLAVWELAIAKTGGYVYSRLLTAIASATFHVVAFTLIGLEYPVALGVFTGIISSLIPVVGTYIAGALPLLIALASSPADALWVIVAIVVYQQIENYLVAPRITAATMAMHPAIAFVSVLIGAALLGAVGALLALPAFAIVGALFSAYGERHDVAEHGLTHEPPPAPGGR